MVGRVVAAHLRRKQSCGGFGDDRAGQTSLADGQKVLAKEVGGDSKDGMGIVGFDGGNHHHFGHAGQAAGEGEGTDETGEDRLGQLLGAEFGAMENFAGADRADCRRDQVIRCDRSDDFGIAGVGMADCAPKASASTDRV